MRVRSLVAAAGLLGCVGIAFAIAAGSRGPAWEHRPLGDPEASRLVIDEPERHWSLAGYAELVPAIAPPTRRDGSSRIEVWVRVPAGASITIDDAGAPVLPAGTEADRVERIRVGDRWLVGDVRGARLEAGGARRMRLLRPERPGAGSRLVGYAWPEARPDLSRDAHATLADLVRAGGGFAATSHGDVDAIADLFLERRGCVACHARARAASTHASQGVPFRETDGAGFYTPLAVLRDAAPLERYRPRDLNHAREHVRITCPGGEPRRVDDERGGIFFRCEGGALPVATLDLEAALAAGEERARRVCASRRYLFERMDPRAQRAWAGALTPCLDDRPGSRTGG